MQGEQEIKTERVKVRSRAKREQVKGIKALLIICTLYIVQYTEYNVCTMYSVQISLIFVCNNNQT